MKKKTKNYLSNRDILAEIHKSKVSYCQYSDESDANMDIVVSVIPEKYNDDSISYDSIITREVLNEAKIAKVKKEALDNYYAACEVYDLTGGTKPKLSTFRRLPEDITDEELQIRVLTYEHIPTDLSRKKSKRRMSDAYPKMNFIPFKHIKLVKNKVTDRSVTIDNEVFAVEEILISHCDKSGKFSLKSGMITDKLARMYMLLVQRFAQRPNWRGYTYVDEMITSATTQLVAMGLLFNEMKSDNPFGYFTKLASNSFVTVLNEEKKNQNIRDDLLVAAGYTPSNTRKFKEEEHIRKHRETALNGDQ